MLCKVVIPQRRNHAAFFCCGYVAYPPAHLKPSEKRYAHTGQSWYIALQLQREPIEIEHDESQHPVSKLTGWLADQATLFGLLDSLYSLGFPLLSVECLAVQPNS